MLLSLSDVLSDAHKSIDAKVPVDMECFSPDGHDYKVLEKTPFHITADYDEDQKIHVTAEGSITIEALCDRCLTETPLPFDLKIDKVIDMGMSDEEKAEALDEASDVIGHDLDIDRLVFNELLVGWPTKILCQDDCKGICSTCGRNLNEGSCDCEDTGLDPRMSVIQDIFKNFKEV